MEAFNQAYEEITGANFFKNANSSKASQIFCEKSSPKDRTSDINLLYKISSMLDKKNSSSTTYQDDDVFEDRDGTDVSDIDVGGEQSYSHALGDEERRTCLKDKSGDIFTTSNGRVDLTEEEKETFASEGLPLPNRAPLTKAEERALKRIRRKIKNKLSAQESRRKKKEYVEGLEKRVESCNTENSILQQKVDSLETTVRALLTELNRLRKVSLENERRKTNEMKSTGTQTGTCLKCLMKKKAIYRQTNTARLDRMRENNNL
ncbi:unnamed protein product [Porites evermanni]|uniref:BZIP domain-containing protein n=1 Tax=Porites evermanni TaxID=104178 RepID=A0ABN8PF93_9CNID|nr:unnamed protein product [Porites evermanni]